MFIVSLDYHTEQGLIVLVWSKEKKSCIVPLRTRSSLVAFMLSRIIAGIEQGCESDNACVQ